MFIESRLDRTRERLHAAEDSLLAFRRLNPGIFLTDNSPESEAAANLMTQRVSIGAELDVLQSLFNLNAPALTGKMRELEALDRELGNIPSVELDLVRRQRDVKIQERVFEYLTAQFEQAQIQENQDVATVDVLDRAVTPVRKSFPRRGILTMLAFVFSTVVGAIMVISREALASLRLGDDERLRAVVKPRSLLDRLLFGWRSGSRSGTRTEKGL
jgi:hypothetical protein